MGATRPPPWQGVEELERPPGDRADVLLRQLDVLQQQLQVKDRQIEQLQILVEQLQLRLESRAPPAWQEPRAEPVEDAGPRRRGRPWRDRLTVRLADPPKRRTPPLLSFRRWFRWRSWTRGSLGA